MTLAELQHDQIVTIRIGRAGESAPNWGPWHQAKLYLRRRETSLPERLRKRSTAPNVGDIVTLVPYATDQTPPWAEYSQGDYCGDGTFVAEDYYLEIRGLL